jgi:hypothetical protein
MRLLQDEPFSEQIRTRLRKNAARLFDHEDVRQSFTRHIAQVLERHSE